MVRGLYSSAGGLLVQMSRTDAAAANLANAATPGYRRDVPAAHSFSWALFRAGATQAAGTAVGAVGVLPASVVDLHPGPLRHTGRPLDLALEGPGYFVVETPAGPAYTRAAALRLDAGQRLVTAAGRPVLGQAGPVRLVGGSVEVSSGGDVFVDGAPVDRLRVVELPGAAVEKLGDGLLRPAAGAVRPLGAPLVRQGYLEESNVNPVGELVGMISALRAFEAAQRALQAVDRTLDAAVNEIGRA